MNKKNLAVLMVISAILGIWAAKYFPSYKSHGKIPYDLHICQSNIISLTDSVELYNKDNQTKINKLTDETIKDLQEKGYFKGKKDRTASVCIYKSLGDLSVSDSNKAGIIYCVYHGDLYKILDCEWVKGTIESKDKLPQNCSIEDYNQRKNEIVRKIERDDFIKDLLRKIVEIFIKYWPWSIIIPIFCIFLLIFYSIKHIKQEELDL